MLSKSESDISVSLSDICQLDGNISVQEKQRESFTLEQHLDLPDYEMITNVKQRDFKRGKPAIMVNSNKIIVEKLCPDPITVPVGVEAVWALVTPRRQSQV